MRREVARACASTAVSRLGGHRRLCPTLMGPDALGLRGHFQGSLDGAWGDLTSACAEGPSVAIDHLRWEAPQRAISHGGLGYEPNRHRRPSSSLPDDQGPRRSWATRTLSKAHFTVHDEP